MSKSFLEVDCLSKVYPDGQGGELTVFEDIRFSLEKANLSALSATQAVANPPS